MKALAIWVTLSVASFAAGAGGYHSYLASNPNSIAFIVDSSYAMRADLMRAKQLAASLSAAQPYSRFALFTDKTQLHDYAAALSLDRLTAYGPTNLARLIEGRLAKTLAAADQVVLITNASPKDLANVPGSWQILKP